MTENICKENLEDVDHLLDKSYSIDDQSIEDSDNYSCSGSINGSCNYEIDQQKQMLLQIIEAVTQGDSDFIEDKIKNNPEYNELFLQSGPDGLNPIQHAIIYGHTSIVDKLVKVGENIHQVLEGVPTLHLSLSLAMFEIYRSNSIKCFQHLFSYLKDSINENYVDRLGRTLIHFIFQYDLHECLYNKEVLTSIDQLFIKDFNGDMVIDYIYIYDSIECFKAIMHGYFNPENFYKNLKVKWSRDNFIQKCILYNSTDVCYYFIKISIERNLLELSELLKVDLNELINDGNEITEDQSNEEKIENENSSNSNRNSSKPVYKKLLRFLNTSNSNSNSIETNNTSSESQISSEFENSINSINSNPQKTLVIHHNSSFKHGEIKENNLLLRVKRRQTQVENPDRLGVLLKPNTGILNSDFFKIRFEFIECSAPATLVDILRVHDFDYIDSVRKTCEELKTSGKSNTYKYDVDTYINQHTYESATYASGCVIQAVDSIMKGNHKNAICLVRPPGHHAGFYGKVEPDGVQCHSSNGFCFINNVAVGAAYCKYMYREKVKKIAIVDFDVHHGNGTEEIIKFLKKTKVSLKNENKICSFTMEKSVCNPWLDYDDSSDVLFVSIHGYDEDKPSSFYPSSGSVQDNTSKESEIYPGGILNVPINKLTKFSHMYRNLFRARVMPRLIKFKPDLIFVSAGFDGHEHEEINNSYMSLTEFDYRWMTEELMKIAKKYSEGRLISVLEGGYNINSGVVSSFAQSVMTHSKFINICANKNSEECRIFTKIKRKREFERDFENYKNLKKFKQSCSEEIEEMSNEIENEEMNNINSIDSPSHLYKGRLRTLRPNIAKHDNCENTCHSELRELKNFSLVISEDVKISPDSENSEMEKDKLLRIENPSHPQTSNKLNNIDEDLEIFMDE